MSTFSSCAHNSTDGNYVFICVGKYDLVFKQKMQMLNLLASDKVLSMCADIDISTLVDEYGVEAASLFNILKISFKMA